MRNPPWSRDELILALDLYVRRGRKQLDATDPDVVALSGLLNRLPLHGAVTRAEGFRNANGVAMKLGNFTAIDPDYRGAGLRRGGQLERDVWSDFAAEPQQLARTASAIRDCIESADARTSLTADATLRDEDDEFQEGRVLARLHFARERNRSVVQRKKESVLAHTGR